MAGLSYREGGRVPVQDAGVQRLRGLEEAGGYGIQSARIFESVTGLFIQEWQRELGRAGQKEGGTVIRNADGSLGAMQVKDDRTSYGAAFMQAQTAAYGAALTVDAHGTLSRFHQQAIAPTDADGKPLPAPDNPLQQFQQQAQTYITKTVNALPEEYRSKALTELTGRAAQHQLRLTEQVREIELGQQVGKLAEAGQLAMREAVSGLRNGDEVSASTSLKNYNDAIDAMAALDRKRFTPDYVRQLKEQGEISLEAVRYESQAMAAFRKAYSPRYADRGEAAAMKFLEGQRTALIARFGEEGADSLIKRVNAMVNIESRIRSLTDAANERGAQESFQMLYPQLADALQRNIATGGDPVAFQREQRAFVESRYGKRFAAMFDGRTLDAIREFQPDVQESVRSNAQWEYNLRNLLKSGTVAPDQVYETMIQGFRDGTYGSVAPGMQAKMLGIVQDQQMTVLTAAQRKLTEAAKAQEVIAEANRIVDSSMSGGPQFASDATLAGKGDVVIESRGWTYDNPASGAMIANMMYRAGGATPDAKHRLNTIIANPTPENLRTHAGFLSAFMGSRDAEDRILHFMDSDERRRLNTIWSAHRQYLTDMAAAKDDKMKSDVASRYEQKLTAERRNVVDGPKNIASLRELEGPQFEEKATAATNAAIAGATNGGFSLGRVYESRPGFKFVGPAVFGDGDALVKSLDAEGIGDLNSMSWTRFINQIPGLALSDGVKGLATLLGADDPSKWATNVASLPGLGGAFYAWRPVDVGLAERYDLKQAVIAEAAKNGGNWKEAERRVGETYFKDRGYDATLYHGDNYSRTRDRKSPVARMVPYPIDAGPSGPDAVRPMLYRIAEDLLNPKEGNAAKIPGVGSAWEAANRTDIWHIEYDGHRMKPNGQSAPSYRIFVRMGDDQSLVRVGGQEKVFFRPELASEVAKRLWEQSEKEAVEITKRMRMGEVAAPAEGRDLISRAMQASSQGKTGDNVPKGGISPMRASAYEKAIAGALYRGRVFNELGAFSLGREAIVSLTPPGNEADVRSMLGEKP